MMAKRDERHGPTDAGSPPAQTRSGGRGLVSVDHLLAQVARGDSDAFASVYDQVAGAVYSLVRRMIGDPARSHVVTGDVLTEVWRTASLFSPSAGSGMSWIMAIARRHATDHVRAVRAAVGGDTVRPLSRIVQEVAEQAEVSPCGAAADGLASLPEPQRQALLLTCYGGYTQGQVAEFLGVRPRTVSAWIRDGLPRLRDHAPS